MRPPLVLEVFEQHPTIGHLAYRSDGAFMPYTLLATEKRFSDAELAAEYHAQQMEAVRAVDRAYPWGESDETGLETARIYIIESFASLPHFDE